MSHTQTTEHAPGTILAFAAVLTWGAVTLWSYAQQGSDMAAIGAAFLAFAGATQLIRSVILWDKRARRRIIERQASKTSTHHGQAAWATPKEVRKAGLYKRKGSLFIGRLGRRDLYYPGETHLLTIAPPGSGKGTSIAVPNLLLSPVSMIVTDPKAELYTMTGQHREKVLGHKVIVLAPWADKMSAELGVTIPDHVLGPHTLAQFL